MKKIILYAIIFLGLPAGMLITASLKRERRLHEGKPVAVLISEIRNLSGNSPQLEVVRKMGKDAVPELQLALKPGNDHSRRFRAAWVLGQMGSVARDAVPDLMAVVDDNDFSVRYFAIESLGNIGASREDLIPKLTALLMTKLVDVNIIISTYAANALNRIEQDRKAKSLLIPIDEFEYDKAFLHASAPAIRLMGMHRVGDSVQSDERAMSEVKVLLHDTNGWVCQEAARFLNKQDIMRTNGISGFTTNSVQVVPQR